MAKFPAPHEISELIADRNVIVFDGMCVLCSGFLRFMAERDRARQFFFVMAQSELGEELYARLGLKSGDYDTNIVIRGGLVFTKLDAVAASVGQLDGVWKLARLLRVLPRPFADWIYDRIARNRYAIFGRTELCMMAGPDLQARFLGPSSVRDAQG